MYIQVTWRLLCSNSIVYRHFELVLFVDAKLFFLYKKEINKEAPVCSAFIILTVYLRTWIGWYYFIVSQIEHRMSGSGTTRGATCSEKINWELVKHAKFNRSLIHVARFLYTGMSHDSWKHNFRVNHCRKSEPSFCRHSSRRENDSNTTETTTRGTITQGCPLCTRGILRARSNKRGETKKDMRTWKWDKKCGI